MNATWAKKLKTDVQDTGNAMTDAEVDAFSRKLSIKALKAYRVAVGRRSRDIIQSLGPDDMKRKPARENLERIMAEKGLTEQKGSKWLLEFWGKKTVGGLLLLPLTRHHLMHLEAACQLMAKMEKPV